MCFDINLSTFTLEFKVSFNVFTVSLFCTLSLWGPRKNAMVQKSLLDQSTSQTSSYRQEPTDNTLTYTHDEFAYICMGPVFILVDPDHMKPPLFVTNALSTSSHLKTHFRANAKLP